MLAGNLFHQSLVNKYKSKTLPNSQASRNYQKGRIMVGSWLA